MLDGHNFPVLVLMLLWRAFAEQPTDPSPRLRQTGEAAGYTEQTPRETLCELAEERAWCLVWKSCDDDHRLVDVVTGACATVDYRAASADGKGPRLEVRVQVEYDCIGAD